MDHYYGSCDYQSPYSNSNTNALSINFHDYLCSNNVLTSIFASFIFAMIFAPWTYGVFWLVIYILVWEIGIYFLSLRYPGCWNIFARAAIIFSSILGFIVGRTVTNDGDVLKRGKIPFMKQ